MTGGFLVYSEKQEFSRSTIVDVLIFYSLCTRALCMQPYEIQYISNEKI